MRKTDKSQAALFDFTGIFLGQSSAEGLFEDRKGRVKRRFSVDINGYWQDEKFFLDESFVFDDGETDKRLWKLTFSDDGTFAADCPDAPEPGAGVLQPGSAVLKYKFDLKHNGKTYRVDFVDTFVPLGADTVINRAIMSKWGITLGQVTIVLKKAVALRKAA